MARNQKNFGMIDYLDDSANNWSVRGEKGGAFDGVDGHASTYAYTPWGRQTKNRHVRHVVAQDNTTFRTVRGIIYTPTAFAAIDIGDTIAVQVAGLATTVNYLVSEKIPERQPSVHAPRPLADT